MLPPLQEGPQGFQQLSREFSMHFLLVNFSTMSFLTCKQLQMRPSAFLRIQVICVYRRYML